MIKKISTNRDDYHKNVVKTWSDNVYKKYVNSPWRWADLPFRDYVTKGNFFHKEYLNQNVSIKIEGKSILEIGSAMGCAYKFMKNSNLIDLSEYTGVEVSKVGYDYCVKNYPEANWLHKDFTKIPKLDNVNYCFERNAIHHMPDPLKAYKKILLATNTAFSTCFRSCLNGATFSDLNLSNFKSSTGIYYCSVINLFDVIRLGLENDFYSMKITYGGKHEYISNDPNHVHFMDKNINQNEIFLSRCKVYMIKTGIQKQPTFNFVARPDVVIKNLNAIYLIQKQLKKIKKEYSN